MLLGKTNVMISYLLIFKFLVFLKKKSGALGMMAALPTVLFGVSGNKLNFIIYFIFR